MAHAHQMHDNGRIDLAIAGLTAAVGDHIGHYYQNEAESRALVVEYLAAGLQAGDEKCVYLCDDAVRDRIGSALGEQGIDVAEAMASGQLTTDNGPASPEELTDFLHHSLKSHPLSIVGNTLHRNPYFVDPADFLHEIRSRPRTQLVAY